MLVLKNELFVKKIIGNNTFFFKIFGHIKKKQYLCTRFQKGSAT